MMDLWAQNVHFRRPEIETQDVTVVCKTDSKAVQDFECVLAKMTEDACKMASHLVETSGLSSKTTPNITANERLNYAQKDTKALNDRWLDVTRTLYCANIHLNHAKQYHMFHYEVKQLQDALDVINSEFTNFKKVAQNDVTKLRNNLKFFQDSEKRLLNCVDWIERLCATSKTVSPVHVRTEPSKDPFPALTLCKYETDTFCIESNEHILLLDHSNTVFWKCRLASGEEVQMPSVCIVIPSPDINIMKKAARLEESYKDLNSRLREHFASQISILAKYILLEMNKMKIRSLSSEQQQELLELVNKLEKYVNKYTTADPFLADNFKKLEQRVLQLIVLELVDTPDPEVEELLVLLRLWLSLEQLYERSANVATRHKQLIQEGTVLDEHTKWDALAEVVEARRQMQSIKILMDTESAAISGKDTYQRSISESTTNYTVKSVRDTRRGKDISIDDAIECGIIDPSNGLFQDLKTGQSYPIHAAINAGFINIESESTQLSKELKASVGVVTVEYTRETRPFIVTSVLDPNTQEHVDVRKAKKLGLINGESKTYTNTITGETMSFADAVDSGALLVEYDTEAEVITIPKTTRKTFAISWVLDRATGKRRTFDDAVDEGLIVKDLGLYHDTVTKEKLPLVDAMKKQYVRGRVVDDPKGHLDSMRMTMFYQDSDRQSYRLSYIKK